MSVELVTHIITAAIRPSKRLQVLRFKGRVLAGSRSVGSVGLLLELSSSSSTLVAAVHLQAHHS